MFISNDLSLTIIEFESCEAISNARNFVKVNRTIHLAHFRVSRETESSETKSHYDRVHRARPLQLLLILPLIIRALRKANVVSDVM